jgi:hypothetical protein
VAIAILASLPLLEPGVFVYQKPLAFSITNVPSIEAILNEKLWFDC